MDLNYLLLRLQVERSRARAVATEAAREAHNALARNYEQQIGELAGNGFSVAADPAPSKHRIAARFEHGAR
jgi:hypothetical protein